jgi:putative ABC transport system permease protein
MFFSYLGRELRRRRRQAIVIALGLALGIGLTITVTAASAGVKAAQNAVLHSLYGVGTDMTVTSNANPGSGGGPVHFGLGGPGSAPTSQEVLTAPPGASTIGSATLAKIRKVSGVSAAVGSLNLVDIKITVSGNPGSSTSQGQSSSGQNERFTPSTENVAGVDTSDLTIGPMSALTKSSGRLLDSADSGKDDAVVTKTYAESNNLKLGGTLTLDSKSFTIVGIVTGTSNDDIYIPLGVAQSLSSETGNVTEIYVTADNSSEIGAISAAIQKIDSSATVTTASDLAGTVTGSIDSTASLANGLGRLLEILVLIAAFVVAGLLTMSAVGRRVTEFGTLKALGWTSRRVVRQVVGEGVVTGLAGGAAGIALGFGGAFVIDRISPALTIDSGGTTPVSGPISGSSGTQGAAPVTSDGGRPGGLGASVVEHLTAPISIEILLIAVLLAVLGGLIAGGFGGWRASAMRPADALRKVA